MNTQIRNYKLSALALMSIAVLFITACRKYPEGPTLSLRSKTERVANNWKIAQAFENGHDVTSDYDKYDLSLTKSGTATIIAKYKFMGTFFDFMTDGTWRFVNNNEKISFDFDKNGNDGVYRIIKLKENEMWLIKDGEALEFHYVPQ